eukprot:scaffold12535_cov70-Isochrysis_galbana.AAC.1
MIAEEKVHADAAFELHTARHGALPPSQVAALLALPQRGHRAASPAPQQRMPSPKRSSSHPELPAGRLPAPAPPRAVSARAAPEARHQSMGGGAEAHRLEARGKAEEEERKETVAGGAGRVPGRTSTDRRSSTRPKSWYAGDYGAGGGGGDRGDGGGGGVTGGGGGGAGVCGSGEVFGADVSKRSAGLNGHRGPHRAVPAGHRDEQRAAYGQNQPLSSGEEETDEAVSECSSACGTTGGGACAGALGMGAGVESPLNLMGAMSSPVWSVRVAACAGLRTLLMGERAAEAAPVLERLTAASVERLGDPHHK